MPSPLIESKKKRIRDLKLQIDFYNPFTPRKVIVFKTLDGRITKGPK